MLVDDHGNRRRFLSNLAYGFAAVGIGAATLASKGRALAAEGKFPLSLTPAEWKKRLTPAQYRVLREEGTERAFTSSLNDQHGKGIFACAGCATKLFASATKFDSGTGWPSFYEPLDGAVAESRDTSFGTVRREVHCTNCGGHLGHVFEDGPKPTGLRYCMNGVAMSFQPAQASS